MQGRARLSRLVRDDRRSRIQGTNFPLHCRWLLCIHLRETTARRTQEDPRKARIARRCQIEKHGAKAKTPFQVQTRPEFAEKCNAPTIV